MGARSDEKIVFHAPVGFVRCRGELLSLSWSQSYDTIWQLLAPEASLWQRSILKTYHPGISWGGSAWVENLESAADDECLWRLDREEPIPLAEGPLRNFLEAWRALPRLPMSAEERPLQTTASVHAKKQHEIRRILAFLMPQLASMPVAEAIDLGGGVGHLARELTLASSLQTTSVDQDATLQEQGRRLAQQRASRGIEARLHFLNRRFGSDQDPAIDELLHADVLSLGLHTCGPLALHHLGRSLRCRHIFNIGCCYDKLDPCGNTKQSRHAQDRGGPVWTQAALFLATRGRHQKTWDQYQLQKRVNHYRSALHLWLIESGRASGFVTLGNAPKDLYRRRFSDYAAQVLCETKHRHELELYWREPRVAAEVQHIWLLHLIRERFARPLELCLLLDRALWLEEQGRQCQLVEIFNPQLSPRNIALYSCLEQA